MPWMPTSAPTRQRYDGVWFFDQNVAVAVNSGGGNLKTEDGGANWRKTFQTRLIPPRNRAVYLRCLAFADRRTGWAGTLTREHGLFATRDGSDTWAQVETLMSAAPAKIRGLYAVSPNVVYGAGMDDPRDSAAMIKTTDAGVTWQTIDMADRASNLIDVYFRDERRGFVVGGISHHQAPNYDNVRPAILYVEDGGQSWIDRLEPLRAQFVDGSWAWKIQFVTDALGYVAVENFDRAEIVKTIDHGLTWTKIGVPGNANLEGVGFLVESVAWVGGWGDSDFASGTSSATKDGGRTWFNADAIGRFINRLRFFGAPVRFGYASGQSIYRYSSPSGLHAASPPLVPGVIATVDVDAYRGPVVPIRFSVPPGARHLSIQIWNRFGTEIRLLVNENVPAPGKREFGWNRTADAGIPVRRGIYLYRLTIDGRAESGVVALQ